MKRLTPTEGIQRRERYYELRRDGVSHGNACAELGVGLWTETWYAYERYYQAIERGEEIISGKTGPKARKWPPEDGAA